jgi:hypothetical protein
MSICALAGRSVPELKDSILFLLIERRSVEQAIEERLHGGHEYTPDRRAGALHISQPPKLRKLIGDKRSIAWIMFHSLI